MRQIARCIGMQASAMVFEILAAQFMPRAV
jgi:hypothetical protein